MRAFDRWLGGELSVATAFVPVDVSPATRDRFVDERLTPLWERGIVPVVTLEPWRLGESASSELSGGRHGLDEQFRAWATRFAAWVNAPSSPRRRLVLRPAHEMNGSWYPWSVGAGVAPAEYRRMWRRFREIARDETLTGERVQWLWSVTAETTADVELDACYPGDTHVDMVGVDGYNFGASQEWSTWAEPSTVFESAFERVRELSEAPLTVPEFGCSSVRDGGSDPTAKASWITDAFELFDAWDVRVAGWFNVDKETDWRVLDLAAGPDSRYPAVVRLDGTTCGVYPSFRRAALRYLDRDGAGERSR